MLITLDWVNTPNLDGPEPWPADLGAVSRTGGHPARHLLHSPNASRNPDTFRIDRRKSLEGKGTQPN